MELKLGKERLFFNLLEAIFDLVDVANVDCSSTGLMLQAVDIERVAVIVLFFPAEVFKDYHFDGRLSVGISIHDMVTAFRCADKDDSITIKFSDVDDITLSFESPTTKTAVSLPSVDAESQCFEMPDWQYTATKTAVIRLPSVDAKNQCFEMPDWQDLVSTYDAFVRVPSAEFMSMCKYLSIGSSDGQISVTEKCVKIIALGTIGDMCIKYMQPGGTADLEAFRAPVSLDLDLKYMTSFVKVSTLFDQLMMCLSTGQPLVVNCTIGETGYIRYFVAPKLNTEIEEEEIKKGKSGEHKESSKESKNE